MRLLETDTLTAQDISDGYVDVGSYTADAARLVYIRLFMNGIMGDTSYQYYLGIQPGGAGVVYWLPWEAPNLPPGPGGCLCLAPIPVAAGDVLSIKLQGFPQVDADVDIICEFWEDDSLRPTTPDRTLDVAATGEAGVDLDNLKQATAPTTLTNLTVPAVTTVGAVSGAVGSVTAGVTVTTNSDKTGYALTAAYDAAKTAAPTGEAAAALAAYDPPTDAEMDAALLALRGGDSDTLETLSDQLDAQEPAGVWSYATRTLTASAASTTATVSGSAITIQRGDTLSASLTGLGSLAARTKLWFTVKRSLGDADSEAIIQIEETAGLLYLNGAAGTAASGDITVTDAAAGDITITLTAASTAALTPAAGLVYDVQQLTAAGVATLTTGTVEVSADVTRAVS